jgi:hypothetical protein
MLLDQMRNDFGISLGGKLVAFFDQLLLQAQIVFDNAIVDDHNLAGAIAMGMSVLFSGASMGGPAGVANAVTTMQRILTDGLFQVAELAFGAADLQLVSVAGDSNSSGVITAVFEPAQALDDDRNYFFFTDVSDDATHAESSRNLVCERATKLFNDRIGEYFASDAFDFRLRLLAVEGGIQGELEIFSLADFFKALITHLLESAMDGLALGIEHSLLERNVDVGGHGDKQLYGRDY